MVADRVESGTRAIDHVAATPPGPSPHRSAWDHRYARPHAHHVHHHPHANYGVPISVWYAPWYTRWYCHPWWPYHYDTTMVVAFGYPTWAWHTTWVPPARVGWIWIPGTWYWGYWHPGFWEPAYPPPPHYVYVPGWWQDDIYVEGYYRRGERDGWEWVEGGYLEDGTFLPGHWAPLGRSPDGYSWEPGIFDGETWVDGFWRPEFRQGYAWVSAAFDRNGVFHAGHWIPLDDRPGHVWIPGWFDGNVWIDGYWVTEAEVQDLDLESWQPEEGYDAGWDEEAPPQPGEDKGDLPLAVPVGPDGGAP